jgi:hypothetical protein
MIYVRVIGLTMDRHQPFQNLDRKFIVFFRKVNSSERGISFLVYSLWAMIDSV